MNEKGRAALAALGLLTAVACGRGSAAATKAPQASPSPILPAEVREVAEANRAATASPTPASAADDAGPLAFSGEFVSSMQSEVAARIGGRVARVMVDQGQRVTRGQALLQLETPYLELDVRRARAELARATASAAEAEREFARKKDLLAKGSVPQATFDRASSAFEQAQAAREAASSAVALAQQRLDDASVVSPVEGVVVERRADVGEHLGDGAPAFVLAQTAPLKLRFRMPERYLASVRTGGPVKALVDPYPGESFAGRIAVVGGSVDPQTRTFTVDAEFPNRDGRLKPGLFARVEVEAARAATAAGSR